MPEPKGVQVPFMPVRGMSVEKFGLISITTLQTNVGHFEGGSYQTSGNGFVGTCGRNRFTELD